MMIAACLGLLTKAQTVIPAYVPTNGLVGGPLMAMQMMKAGMVTTEP